MNIEDRRNLHYFRDVLGPAVALLAAAAFWGCSGDVAGDSKTPSDELPTQIVQGRVEPVVLLGGELVAEDALRLTVPSVNIFPMTVRWIADEGDAVSEGDTVVEFDNSQLASNLEMLRSQVVTAANSLSQARARAGSERATAFFELEQKKADWEKARLEAEIPKELTSEQEWARRRLDLSKAALEKKKAEKAMAATESATKASIAIEQLALEKAEVALRRAERGVEILNVTAPRDGIVQVAEKPREDRPFRSGDATWPGITVASLPDLASLYVEASLFDVDDGRIEAGARVRASLDAFPEETLEGVVRQVAGFAQQEGRRSSRRSFTVLVDVEGIDPSRMRPGMSVKLEVLPKPEEGLVAPRWALTFDGDEVFLQLANGERVPVEVGTCDRRVCLVEGADGEAVTAGMVLADKPGGVEPREEEA